MKRRRDLLLLFASIIGSLTVGLMFLIGVSILFLPIYRNYAVYDSNNDHMDDSPRRVVSELAWRLLEPPPPRYIIESGRVLFLRQVAYRSWLIQWVPTEIDNPTKEDIAAWRRENPDLDAAMKGVSATD